MQVPMLAGGAAGAEPVRELVTVALDAWPPPRPSGRCHPVGLPRSRPR